MGLLALLNSDRATKIISLLHVKQGSLRRTCGIFPGTSPQVGGPECSLAPASVGCHFPAQLNEFLVGQRPLGPIYVLVQGLCVLDAVSAAVANRDYVIQGDGLRSEQPARQCAQVVLAIY